MSIILSSRLKTISNMVRKGSIVADIGADHGKLIISLYEEGIISHGYAVENKKGPYSRLVEALKNESLEDIIVPLFSDGISDLPTNVDTLVIAGMGGENIIKILTSHKEKLNHVTTIIVDAHSCIPKLRAVVTDLGFVIADEKMVKDDNVYYEIIKFCKADKAFYTDRDLEFGPILRNEKSALFKEKYQNRLNDIESILNNHSLPESRIKELLQEEKNIKGIL